MIDSASLNVKIELILANLLEMVDAEASLKQNTEVSNRSRASRRQ